MIWGDHCSGKGKLVQQIEIKQNKTPTARCYGTAFGVIFVVLYAQIYQGLKP